MHTPSHKRAVAWPLVLLVAINFGCTSSDVSTADSIVGKWVCRDMSDTGHTAHVHAFVMHFKATGEFESFYVAEDGTMERVERDEESPRWRVDGKKLHIGDAPPIEYHIVGSVLRMTLTDTHQDQLTLVFARQR